MDKNKQATKAFLVQLNSETSSLGYYLYVMHCNKIQLIFEQHGIELITYKHLGCYYENTKM